MYITKTSSDEDGSNNWNTSLTLVDYPPSLSTEEEETEEETESKDSTDTNSSDTSTTEEATS